jgi:acid phosphatase
MAAKRSTASSLANPPFWYSFEYGMAHFVFFNTETDFGSAAKGPEDVGNGDGFNDGPFATKGVNQQLEFLKADLAGVNRALTRE